MRCTKKEQVNQIILILFVFVYLQGSRAELAHLAHHWIKVDKYLPSTCCIVGKYPPSTCCIVGKYLPSTCCIVGENLISVITTVVELMEESGWRLIVN